MSDDQPQPSSDPAGQVETPAVVSSGGGAGFEPPSVEDLNAVLPQYEFVEMIGLGGMGAVYKARQPKLNRFVAIKILPPIPDDELGFAERFEREAQAMAQLSHPHIVAVYDFGETAGGQLYFVMEFIEGADLHQLIAGGQLNTEHFYGWVPQICEAIQFAHDNGIVHRDIKPANILIDKHGRVRMADFGLAKLTDANEPQTALTLANVSMGTPDYAAPEQIDPGMEIDWRADIYSLGVVMYHMLTGQVPRGAFPMPSEKIGGLDRRLDEVVLKAMQSNPADRFQRAADITTRLTAIRTAPAESVAVAEPTTATAPVSPKKKPKSLLLPVLGLVAASVLLGLVFNKNRNQRKEARPSKPTITGRSKEKTPGRPPSPSPAKSKSKSKSKPDQAPAADPRPRPIPSAADPRPRPMLAGPQKNGEGEGIALKPGPGKFASFKDKLRARGRKGGAGPVPEGVRESLAENLQIARIDGRTFESDGNRLADFPPDLKRVLDVRIGQGPTSMKGGEPFVVVLQADGSVAAWGYNKFGQTDVPEGAASGVIQIAAGPGHGLALKDTGEVLAWGRNDSGQCDVPGSEVLGTVEKLVAGLDFSAALREDETVVAWGADRYAGIPDEWEGIADIEAGYRHLLARKRDGTVVSIGTDEFGQSNVPADLGEVIDIAVTFGNSFALLENRNIVGWGENSGKRPVPPEMRVAGIEGSGESLMVRDDRDRMFVVGGQRVRPGGPGGLLRPGPPGGKLLFSAKHVLLLTPGRMGGAGEGNRGMRDDLGARDPTPAPDTAGTSPSTPEKPETEASKRIADLQEKFEAAYLEQVDKPFEVSIEQLNEFYLNALEAKQTEAAGASRLDDAVALREEAERIGREGSIPKNDAADAPEVLKELRQTYRSQTGQYESDRLAREADLLAKYAAALEALQNEFTQAQMLDDALEVQAFREERAGGEGE